MKPATAAELGPVGMCYQYVEGPSGTVADAVVVVSSRDARRDREARDAFVETRPPQRELFDRTWFAVWAGDQLGDLPLLDCEKVMSSRPKG